MRDQLHRSALSVVRNIAEAASRTTPADRRARFTVARGECAECDATLEVALRLGILPSGRVEAMRVLADRVGAMLTGLLRKETARQASREPAPSSSGM
jgi:four helix bundle protein